MKRSKWRLRVGIALFVALLLSILFAIYKIITTPQGIENIYSRSHYTLILIQCCLGLLVTALPSILERKFSLAIPNSMSIAYYIFLFCAVYLGEVHNFYYLIPYWDNILHCFSGAMLGALGFTLVKILNDSDRVHVVLSPVFICLFAFCFALAAGAVWEIYEFTGDTIFSLNMQKYRLEDGTMLAGSEALEDTMHDLIIDAVGALSVVIVGFAKEFFRKNKAKKAKKAIQQKESV